MGEAGQPLEVTAVRPETEVYDDPLVLWFLRREHV
jgi:hypothetical protein